eukprot:GSMAST32.ASY1.ANO1.2099.1 assembled CDS
MSKQLRQNVDSHAFDGFYDFSGTLGNATSSTLDIKHALIYEWAECAPSFKTHVAKAIANGEDRPVGLECTGLSWNSNGAVVCATFGRTDHNGWCCHALNSKPALCVWNIFSRDLKCGAPQLVYETSSCLTCISCHPTNPAIVAVGTFNGEVLVFNIGKDDALEASSQIDDYFHREPVSSIEWISSSPGEPLQIASISGDGKVLFWERKSKLKYPSGGFLLLPQKGHQRGEDNRDRLYSSNRRGKDERNLGGISLSFSQVGSLSSSFVTGTEAGGMFKSFLRTGISRKISQPKYKGWSRNASRVLDSTPKNTKVKLQRHVEEFVKTNRRNISEITADLIYLSKPPPHLIFPGCTGFAFDRHIGPVYSLACSPFSRNIFLSGGADGHVRLNSMLNVKAISTLEVSSTYVYSVAWSAFRPLLFATGTEDGSIFLYDLFANQHCPIETLIPSDNEVGAAVNCICFNPRQRDFLAAGDASGAIWIWKLPWHLSNEQQGELSELEFIGMDNNNQHDTDSKFN